MFPFVSPFCTVQSTQEATYRGLEVWENTECINRKSIPLFVFSEAPARLRSMASGLLPPATIPQSGTGRKSLVTPLQPTQVRKAPGSAMLGYAVVIGLEHTKTYGNQKWETDASSSRKMGSLPPPKRHAEHQRDCEGESAEVARRQGKWSHAQRGHELRWCRGKNSIPSPDMSQRILANGWRHIESPESGIQWGGRAEKPNVTCRVVNNGISFMAVHGSEWWNSCLSVRKTGGLWKGVDKHLHFQMNLAHSWITLCSPHDAFIHSFQCHLWAEHRCIHWTSDELNSDIHQCRQSRDSRFQQQAAPRREGAWI